MSVPEFMKIGNATKGNKFLVCLHGDYESKYNFVKTPRKFTIAKLSIRKLGFSRVLIIMH